MTDVITRAYRWRYERLARHAREREVALARVLAADQEVVARLVADRSVYLYTAHAAPRLRTKIVRAIQT
jgi:hypothetical protein